MDHPVFGRQRPDILPRRHRVGQQGVGIGLGPRRQRQDGMMHVDHPVTLDMDHRRQFMHPLAIIGIVIGVFLHPFPARRHQRRLDLRHCRTRHQNIQVADEAALPRHQSSGCIGRAFEHHQPHAERRQRRRRAIRLPQGLARLPRRVHARVAQDGLDRFRQPHSLDPPRQCRDQPLRLRRRDQAVPLRCIQMLDSCGLTQRAHQQGRAHAPSSHSRSIISNAASPDGKSIAQAGTSVTKRVSAAKPGSPNAT